MLLWRFSACIPYLMPYAIHDEVILTMGRRGAMKRRAIVIILLVLAVPCLASGQSQTAPPPKPGPEVLRLGYFVGTWMTDTGETVTWEWFTGGFSLIGHVENSGPEGKSTELRIMTYDPDTKTYSQYRVTSMGPGGELTTGGTVTGNTWLWQWDGTASGKPAKYRFTIVEVTPTSFTAKLEVSVADGPWTVAFETKGHKIK